jgi:adenosylcobinamide-GDP ribazoletransferase
MQKSQNTSKFYDHLWAAFIFFTRLPFWRVYQPPKSSYAAVVEWWPLTGWFIGGAMAATLYYCAMVMPYAVAVIAAIVIRLLITGALHEDGLADFFDGFGGGGSDRQRILDIMKDSHIGTYGVLSLILYIALLVFALISMSPKMAALTILAANPFSKMITSFMVVMMPYARTEETAKNKTVYRTIDWKAGISLCIQGLLPLIAFLWYTGLSWMIVIVPCLVTCLLCWLIWRRLRGYTGDCCGAVCLLSELSFYLTVCALVA